MEDEYLDMIDYSIKNTKKECQIDLKGYVSVLKDYIDLQNRYIKNLEYLNDYLECKNNHLKRMYEPTKPKQHVVAHKPIIGDVQNESNK